MHKTTKVEKRCLLFWYSNIWYKRKKAAMSHSPCKSALTDRKYQWKKNYYFFKILRGETEPFFNSLKQNLMGAKGREETSMLTGNNAIASQAILHHWSQSELGSCPTKVEQPNKPKPTDPPAQQTDGRSLLFKCHSPSVFRHFLHGVASKPGLFLPCSPPVLQHCFEMKRPEVAHSRCSCTLVDNMLCFVLLLFFTINFWFPVSVCLWALH